MELSSAKPGPFDFSTPFHSHIKSINPRRASSNLATSAAPLSAHFTSISFQTLYASFVFTLLRTRAVKKHLRKTLGVGASSTLSLRLYSPLTITHYPLFSVPYNIRVLHSSTTLVGQTLSIATMTEQDRQISEVIAEQRGRLRNFIRRRVPDPSDAEDIMQEVFYELVEANRLLMPINHVNGWLFRVARNRITDLFRKKKPEIFSDAAVEDEAGELLHIEDLLPSPDAGPEALYFRSVLLDELEFALGELPREQREVFVAHELEERSFKELSAESGVSVNTLLSRKRYALLHLRERLHSIYDEFAKR